MLCIVNTTQNIPDYTPEIIGILGTVLGTVLGTILGWVLNNIGKTHILVDSLCEQKSNHNEYAYIVKMFVYNTSHKQQCIRNARFFFTDNKRKILIKSVPSEGACNFEEIRSKNENKKKMSIISINSYAQSEYIFSDLIDGENYNKLSMVRKIYFLYEDKKNHIKKKLVKTDFSITSVEKCKWESFL